MFVSLKEALVGLVVGNIHKVHVLDPALSNWDHFEPEAGNHMDSEDQDNGHHDDLEVYFDVLRQIRSLDGIHESWQTQ